MERELRELLERKADEVRPGFEIPPGVLRRARRRRVRAALVTVVVTGALGFGGFLGARAVLDGGVADGPPAQPAGESTVTEDQVAAFVSEFMERRISESGAEAFLSADAKQQYEGHHGDLYLYSPVSNPYYARFQIRFIDRLEGDPHAFDVLVLISEETYSFPGEEVGFVLERLIVGPGRTHEGTEADLVVRTASREDPINWPDAAFHVVTVFMDQRLAGSGAERYLSAGARSQFAAGKEGLALYPPRREPEWLEWEIPRATGGGDEGWRFVVNILVEYPSTTEQDTITEVLFVGPETTVDGVEAPLVVLSAKRVA